MWNLQTIVRGTPSLMKATNYPGSLVGKEGVVDQEGDGRDFRIRYPYMNKHGVFTITSDPLIKGRVEYGGRISRPIKFKDDAGREANGDAGIFNILI